MGLTTNTLKITSTQAAQLWRQLNRTQEPEAVEELFNSLPSTTRYLWQYLVVPPSSS